MTSTTCSPSSSAAPRACSGSSVRITPTAPLLQTVQQAAERAAGLTRPLLTFSRNQVLTVEQVHLNDAVEESARMMHRLLGVNVQLRLDLANELPGLRTNPNQLQQVLVNLGVNARDAMDGIGTLYITTRLAARPANAPEARTSRIARGSS